MTSPQDNIRRIIRRALDDARPEAIRRAIGQAAEQSTPLAFTPRYKRRGREGPRGLFKKRLVISRDARSAFASDVVVSCYNTLRLVALRAGPLADTQEFSDPADESRRLGFVETAEYVLAYVPADEMAA